MTDRELLEAAESILSAGIVCDGPRLDLAAKIRNRLAWQDLSNHCQRCQQCRANAWSISSDGLCLDGQALRRAIK